MPNKTSIQWTDFSSQLIRYRDADGKDVWACAKCSPGCAHCYSEAIAERFRRGGPFNQATIRGVTPYFAEDEAKKVIHSKALAGRRVFVGDMTDVFGEWVPDELLDLMFATFAMRPDVTFQVLTKRAGRMARYFNGRDSHLAMTRQFVNFREYTEPVGPWPLPNVHLGVSVENQAAADERISHLLRVPAAVRFLSMEPLLGDVDLGRWILPSCKICGGVPTTAKDCRCGDNATTDPGLHWAIVGGESGAGARPCDLAWVRSIRDQCREAGVPVFIKQLGAKPRDPVKGPEFGLPDGAVAKGYAWGLKLKDKHGGNWDEWPVDLRVRELPALEPAR